MNSIIEIFDEAIAKLDAFLNGPAADLIQERINFTGEMLPFEVIYGWQSDPPPRGGRGLWHIVKVEARIPERCKNACNPSQTGFQPWVFTDEYKRNWGTQRCYELKHTDGTVKIRVTRYDENRPSNALFFPNGLRIWDFRSHFDRSSSPTPANIESSSRGCEPFGGIGSPYEGAFLVNGPIQSGPNAGQPWSSNLPSDNGTCWGEANALISAFGVRSETCAKYYFHEGARHGFDFQFVPCKPF